MAFSLLFWAFKEVVNRPILPNYWVLKLTKKRGYFPLFWLILLILQRSQSSFLGMVNGVKSFINNLFLHFWSNSSFNWMWVGEHYPNRTSVIEKLLFIFITRASYWVQDWVAFKLQKEKGTQSPKSCPLALLFI